MRARRDATLYLGTSSWSESAWVGPFYPKGTKPGAFLTVYAEEFRAVEADVTYYRVPDQKLVDGWNRKTPEGFRLCAKFPRGIVHAGDGPRPDATKVLVWEHVAEDTERFLTNMQRMGEKLGPLLLQFPYFNKQAFPSREPFLERLADFLDRLPNDVRVAVEVRNRDWIDAELTALLRARSRALALVDLAYLPHPADWPKRVGGKPGDLVTADFVYARLIGDRKKTEAAAEKFDRVVLDMSRRLDRWAELLDVLRHQVDEVYAFANNHYAGYGPGTIRDLAGRLV